jgi:cytochrome c peroxidase
MRWSSCSWLALAACHATSDAIIAGTSSSTAIATSDVDTHDLESSSEGSTVATSTTTDGESTGADTGTDAWEWDLPPGFPRPRVPDDNPMSAAKVELGRHLFYDVRLSSTGTYACATCHVQALAFTDGRRNAIGETGEVHRRNAMTLANVAYGSSLTWAHPSLAELEEQAPLPIFGDDPIELGLESEAQLVAILEAEPRYAALFAEAFPGESDPIALANVAKGLASFQRTIVSGNSPFDEWFYGKSYGEFSSSAARGWEIFTQPPANCFRCHMDITLSDAIAYEGMPFEAAPMHNIGLYDLDDQGAYPPNDCGLVEITGDPADMGKFKTPSLRNVAVTGPYMHDGSIATLEDVMDHYAAGGRVITKGPNAGDSRDSPLRSEHVQGFPMTERQRADLVALMHTFTDEAFLADPALGDPWAP